MFKFLTAILALSHIALAADLTPKLDWVKVAGGDGGTYIVGAVADPQGNLYITGGTTAIDLANSPGAKRTSPDAFVMKLNPNGDVVYTTYVGGSGTDQASAMALGPGGSIYVTGVTNSNDFPASSGAYLTSNTAAGNSLGFVLRLNASGAVDWATYFPVGAGSIAVDASGNPYIGGSTSGGGVLPTTSGAYNSDFTQTFGSNGFFSVPGPRSAFVTKLNAAGTALVYSTYVPKDGNGLNVQDAAALSVDAAGNTWIGVGVGNSLATGNATRPSVVELNPTGSAIVASASSASLGGVTSIAFDADANVYVAGYYAPATGFPATPGAFQTFSQPVLPNLQYQPQPGNDAFVAKWDPTLTRLLGATLFGGEGMEVANSVAIDPSGNVIIGGITSSKSLPTRSPLQSSFAPSTGFAAAFDSNLTSLLFSTYLGDSRFFSLEAALPDSSGNILVAGTAATPLGGTAVASLIVANKIAPRPATTPRLDSVQHYVSRIAMPIAPGQPIIVLGSGFAPGARILLNGSPLTNVAEAATYLAAVVPYTAPTSGVHTVQVSNNGVLSNPVYVPAAAASPAIYGTDGFIPNGQAYILNSDGTKNSSTNPAAPGSAITIYAAGAGQFTRVGPYAVTSLLPAVFINTFYCNGIAATMEPVPGLPGDVFKLSVTIPSYADLVRMNPDLKTFTYPAQSGIQLIMGTREAGMTSQNGVFLNIK